MVLLQILDEGSVTDSQGRKIDFKVFFLFVTFAPTIDTDEDSEYYHLPHQ